MIIVPGFVIISRAFQWTELRNMYVFKDTINHECAYCYFQFKFRTIGFLLYSVDLTSVFYFSALEDTNIIIYLFLSYTTDSEEQYQHYYKHF